MRVIVDDHKPARVRAVLRRGMFQGRWAGKPGFRTLDSDHHTCPNHVAPTYGDPPRLTPEALATGYPCEGCVAASYALDWLLERVSSLEDTQYQATVADEVRAARQEEA